jgi:hypothetical protein
MWRPLTNRWSEPRVTERKRWNSHHAEFMRTRSPQNWLHPQFRWYASRSSHTLALVFWLTYLFLNYNILPSNVSPSTSFFLCVLASAPYVHQNSFWDFLWWSPEISFPKVLWSLLQWSLKTLLLTVRGLLCDTRPFNHSMFFCQFWESKEWLNSPGFSAGQVISDHFPDDFWRDLWPYDAWGSHGGRVTIILPRNKGCEIIDQNSLNHHPDSPESDDMIERNR